VNTDHDLLVTFLDLRTAGCPHLSKVEMPRLRKAVLKEYVKHGLNDFDCQADAAEAAAKVAAQVSKKQKTSPTSSRPTLSEQRPLSIGVSAGDTNADFGWESGSDDDAIPVMKTPKDRELREKALEVECTVVMKRWVQFAKEVDWSAFVGLKAVVVAPAAGGKSGGTVSSRSAAGCSDTNVVIIEEEPAVVTQKYDLMDDLMGADVLMLFRKVLKEEEAQVAGGGQAQFGYLPRMTLANIGALNAESFCERTLSCANLIVTDLHTSLSHHEVRMLTMLRMNVSLMEYMRTEYDNLTSLIEASETRISKELRDEADRQAKEAEEMESR